MHANTKIQLDQVRIMGNPVGKKARNAFLARKRCEARRYRRRGARVTCTSFAWFYYCSRTLPYRSPPPFALLNSRPASTPAAAQIMALRVISAPECCTPNASARERRVAWLIQGGSVLSIQKKTSQLTTRPHADMITSRAFPAIVASLPALGAAPARCSTGASPSCSSLAPRLLLAPRAP